VDDNRTWLDSPDVRAGLPGIEAFPVPTRPLLLDADGRPKAAHAAVVQRLVAAGP